MERFKNSFFNADLVKTLVGHHHESTQYTEESDRPSSIPDSRVRMLAYLVSRADSLSSAERSESDRSRGYQPRAALDCVFAQVNIGCSLPGDNSKYKYPLGILSQRPAFPEQLDADFEHPESDYEQHMDKFVDEFGRLFPQPYSGMADTLTYLLQKYLWCIPSDTQTRPRDISLADHSKVTGALAACFYRYHEENGWTEESVCDDKTSKVCLVCGDLSGIQNYIYGTASVGHGGVAKRLRGRSFKVTLLTDVIALRILRNLDLPVCCKIMSAGGQFYLLIPNTKKAKANLNEVIMSISGWMLNKYLGELSISIACEDLKPDQLKQGRFDEVLSEARAKLAEAKLRKFEDAISAGQQVFDVEFRGHPACPVCDRRPAKGDSGEPEPCDECENDATLGRLLVENNWLVISEKPLSNSVEFFDDPTWYASVVRDKPIADDQTVFCYDLKKAELVPYVPSGFAFYAGYVPIWKPDEQEKLESYLKRLQARSADGDPDETAEIGDVKSFTALAMESTGDDLLGILREDVDYLGLVFSQGMRGNASLSRIATLSTFLNVFFSIELVRLIEKEYPNTYIAYSGGDDLLLIGPWDETIKLSDRIANEFKRFVACNPNITLSAGIGTYKSRIPIATTSVQTGEILEQSKSAGRNRLTVFGTTIKWDEFDLLRDWAEMLTNSLNLKDEGISKGFLYRLFGYQQQAREYFETQNPSSALYRPHLAYDVARNYTDDKGDPKLVDPTLHEALVSLLESGDEAKRSWRVLQAAITWSSYATRKRKEEK